MSLVPKLNPLRDWDNLPLSHSRIGYNNLLTATTTSAAEKMLTENTYERYEHGGGSTTIKFQLSSPQEIDYVGLAAHNLGTHDNGVAVLVQYAATIGGGLTDLASIAPQDNAAQMELFNTVTAEEIAITFNTTAGLELGVIHAGKALQMYQPLYGGHTPIDLAGSTEFFDSESDTGQFVGRTIIKKGADTSYSYRHLRDDWVRERLKPFIVHARSKPFFIKWRPDQYETAAYCKVEQDIRPSNMGGGHKLMQVSFSVKAHADL